MTYQPKFAPEVYLRFLNRNTYHISDHMVGYMKSASTLTRDLTETMLLRLWVKEGKIMLEFPGKTIEQCLDQAITETGFDKSL